MSIASCAARSRAIPGAVSDKIRDGREPQDGTALKQLVKSEQELDAAIASRQMRLLEGDLDAPNEQTPLIQRLTDEKAATLDALSTIDQRIMETENRLAAERDLALRSAAGKELAVKADALAAVAADLASVVARIPGALADVLSRLPPPHAVSPERIKAFGEALIEALQVEVDEARRHTMRLAAGDAAVVPPRVEGAKPPPAPIVERQQVFLLGRSRWREADGTVQTAGPHVTISPPIEVAKLAIQHGHAIEAGSELAVTLQMRQPPCYAHFSESDCVDISQPKELTKPLSKLTAAAPPVHSEFVGRRRVGTATVRNSL
jgi:hypothetical protein